ncbi:MAG: PIN domain-containing protein [Spirochaetaceae bacterium]|nr:MAG: PIN domain-containing protein [Spirochaetaceae bacterium]
MSLMALYVDSSAILAWIFGEAAGEHARKVMNSVSPVVSSTLSVLEVERAVRRALSVGPSPKLRPLSFKVCSVRSVVVGSLWK